MSDPISLGLGAASSAFNLLKGFVELRDATKVQALKFELMKLLLEAQEAQATLAGEKRQLEERVRQLEAWEAERKRYTRGDVGNGVLAYVLKREAEAGARSHALCPNCFDHGERAVLQPETRVPGMTRYLVCHRCRSDYVISGARHSTHGAPAARP